MKLYRLHRQQTLPMTLSAAWDFFSDPRNLPCITPPWLQFTVISEVPARMFAGMILEYQVRPLLNWPMTWVTEISQVQAPHFFVDEQRFGPYRFWHHQHHFHETPAGVMVEDLVHYALPLGWLGQLAHALYVEAQLHEIFVFRQQALASRFSEATI